MSTPNLPSVTIGIPVYNEGLHIAKTIKSALNQNYPDISVIVSDNASTDNSLEIINSFENNKISIIQQHENIGWFQNFTALLKEAKTPYFMFLGGHDTISSDFVSTAIEKFNKNKNLVCFYSKDSRFTFEDKSSIIDTQGLASEDRLRFIVQNLVAGTALYGLFKTDVLKKSFINLNGGDLLILFVASYFGEIAPCDEVKYFFGENRQTESVIEKQIRYKSFGFDDDWEFQRVMLPFHSTSKIFKFPYFTKIKLLYDLKSFLQRFYPFNWIKLIKYQLFHFGDLNLSYKLIILAIMDKIFKKKSL